MDHLSALATELDRIDALLADVGDDGWARSVPACPGWSLTDLVGHLGEVHRWVVTAVEEGHGRGAASPPGPASLAGWWHDGATRLRATLTVDPAAPAWSFHPPQQIVGFWQRRQLHENLVHRIDVEQALGAPRGPVRAEAAADGLAEVADIFVPRRLREGRLDPLPATVALRPTDVEGDGVVIGEGEPVAEVSGASEALYLALWKRGGTGELAWSGDADLGARVLAMPLSA